MSTPVSTATRLRVIFAWLMSGLMSLLMTGWIGWINAGISPDFLARWAHAFVLAWPAAFTIVLVAAPVVQRVVQAFGADRVMWGSDIAQSPGSYAEMVGLGLEATRTLGETDRAQVLYGATAAVYGGA